MSAVTFRRSEGGASGILRCDGQGSAPADGLGWGFYRKVAVTSAAYVEGVFYVETQHGVVAAQDAWVAIDADGYPYPIAATVFEATMEPADPGGEPSVVERIAELEGVIREKQAEGWGDPRELALALTALEDVQMRFTRGRAKAAGVFKPVDLERVDAKAERERFVAAAADAAQG